MCTSDRLPGYFSRSGYVLIYILNSQTRLFKNWEYDLIQGFPKCESWPIGGSWPHVRWVTSWTLPPSCYWLAPNGSHSRSIVRAWRSLPGCPGPVTHSGHLNAPQKCLKKTLSSRLNFQFTRNPFRAHMKAIWKPVKLIEWVTGTAWKRLPGPPKKALQHVMSHCGRWVDCSAEKFGYHWHRQYWNFSMNNDPIAG